MPLNTHLAKAAWPSAGLGLLGIVLVLSAYDGRDVERMLPHGYCYTWQPALLITHVAADGLIGLAYVSIPLTLMTIIRRRTDVPFNWIGVLFALFIITCGLTHFMEIWTIWHPDYWLSGTVKAICAAISLPTAAVLVYLLPQLLNLPTAQQMNLTLLALEREVAARREAEHALRTERDELERRVMERTSALEELRGAELRALARAEAANEAKDRFLASVSHELRTPMQGALGWAQVLSLQPDLPESARSQVARIQAGIRTLARLVDDLLDLSRVVSGKLQVTVEVVRAADVVDQAVADVRHRADEQRVDLSVDADDCGAVHADPHRLHQVLSNLLVNAINASSPGQRVHVDCTARDGEVRIAVRDEGVGIDPAEIEHLFEPFRQGDGRGRGGLGLGLPISRGLVEEMGGTLSARSAGRGRGATFTVALPIAEPRDVPAGQVPPPADTAGGPAPLRPLTGARVLYVEDDPEVRESVVALMRGQGLQVQVAATYAQADPLVRRGEFDILVCDLALGGPLGGLDLVGSMRALGHTQPALAVSARGFAHDVAATRAAGFDDHLTKPLEAQTLAAHMAALLHAAGASRADGGGGGGDEDGR